MARTAAKVGKGTQLWIAPNSSGTAGTYAQVGELTSVGQPEVTAGTAEATHYESDTSHIEKISSGWLDASDVPFTINYVKSQLNTLRGYVGVEKFFKIVYPDTSTDVFMGVITSLGGGEIPNKETIRTSGKITVIGGVTFTAGS